LFFAIKRRLDYSEIEYGREEDTETGSGYNFESKVEALW